MGINIIKKNPTAGEITSSLTGSNDAPGLHLDGTAGNIDIASPPDLGTKFSMEFIAQADSWADSTYKYLCDFGNGGRFVIGTENSAGAKLAIFDNTSWKTFGAATLDDLKVHHLCVTVDGTAAILYDNGNVIGTATIAANHAIDSCADARLASSYDGTSSFLDGTLYRTRFFNRTLSASDVVSLFEKADVSFSDQYGSQTNLITSAAEKNWGTDAANATAFDAAYDWGSYETASIAVSSNVLTMTTAADMKGIYRATAYSLTAGKRYRFTMATGAISGATYKVFARDDSGYIPIGTLAASTTNNFTFTAYAGSYTGKFYIYQSGAGSGSIVLTAASVTNELVAAGVVADYDLAFSNPTQSLMVQDRAGNADGTASATGVVQVTPIEQLNSKSARIGTTAATPADGNIVVDGQVLVDGGAASAPSFAFSNDTDTGISRPTGDAVNIVTGGTERVRVTSTGMGIGIAPVQNFHIGGGSGTAYQKFSNDAVGNAIGDGTSIGIDADGDFLINNAEAKEIKLYTSDTQRLTISSDGNTLMQSATFPVTTSERDAGSGTTGASGALVLRTKTTGVMANGFGSEMQFRVTDADNTNVPLAAINATRQTNDTSGQLVFRTYKTGSGVDRLTIDEDGNAGLNTSAPNESGFSGDCRVLSVQGAAADGFGVLELITPDVTSLNRLGEIRFVNLDGSASTPAAYAGIRATRDGADDATSLSLWTGTGGSFAERFTISGSGAVTTDGNAGAGYHAVKDNGTLSGYFGSGLGLAASPNNANTDLVNRAVGKLVFCTDNSNVAKMVIDTAGQVNVSNAADPTLKLQNTTGGTDDTAALVFGLSSNTALDSARIDAKRTSAGTVDLQFYGGQSTTQTQAEAGVVITGGATGGIYETGGVLKENLLTNSGFDCWSNSTLCEVTSGAAPVTVGANAALVNNLVSNGGFDSDTTGWTSAAWTGGATGSISSVAGGATGNCLQITSTSGRWSANRTLTSLTVGKLYHFSCWGKQQVGDGSVYLGTTGGGAEILAQTTISASGGGYFSYTFEATSATCVITFAANASGDDFLVDTVCLYEVTPGEIVSGIFTCDGWSKDGAAAHGKSYRQHEHATFTKDGSFYSLKFISHATSDNCLYQVPFSNVSNSTTMSSPEVLARVAGRTMTFGAWVYSASGAADDVGVYISDSERGYSTSQHDVSAFHSASTGWEWLEVTHTFGASPAAATVGFFFDAGTTTSYMSQPMLVFGSAIGEGNYTRPSGEVVMFEKLVNSTGYFTTGFSDVSGTLNVEADSNGCVPKGANGLFLDLGGQDSGSAGTDTYFRCGASSTLGFVYANTYGLANDALLRNSTALCKCDSNGDIEARVEASGSGTFDAYLQYAGVQLR